MTDPSPLSAADGALHDIPAAFLSRPASLTRRHAVVILSAGVTAIGILDAVTGIHYSFAVFYLIPIVLSVAWLDRAHGFTFAVASVVVRLLGDSVDLAPHPLPLSIWWNALSAALVFCLIVWLFAHLLALYRQVERRVEERTADLLDSVNKRKQLEEELLNIAASERQAFGKELHDDICQQLVATALAAKVLAHRLERKDAAASQDALAIVRWIEQGAAKARHLARGLLLASIEPDSLRENLRELAREGSRSGVLCVFRDEGDITLSDAGTAAEIYRIAQEAMRNAIRHAEPRRIEILLAGSADAITLTVSDDGRGLPSGPSANADGIGLRIMALRAASVGATLNLSPRAATGTNVVCYLPRGST